MSDVITPAISDRICQHMNEDHSEAIVLYAQVFGNSPEAETATMNSIDPEGMNLTAEIQGKTFPVRIQFNHTLKDSEDAHQTLIEMAKEARKSQVK